MQVVGLYSGKELLVKDKSFFITVGETIKQVFFSPDDKRRYVVDERRIEFYDEVNTQEYLDKIEQSVKETKERQKIPEAGASYG